MKKSNFGGRSSAPRSSSAPFQKSGPTSGRSGGDSKPSYKKASDRSFGEKREFKPRFGSSGSSGSDRPRFGDKPEGERRSYGSSGSSGSDRPRYGNKPQGERRSYGNSGISGSSGSDRPRFGSDRPERSFGEKREYKPRFDSSDKPQGERRSYGNSGSSGNSGSDRPRYGDKPQGERRSYGSSGSSGSDKPRYGDKSQGERRSYGNSGRPRFGSDRPERSFGEKREYKPRFDSSCSDKPQGERRSFGGDRPERNFGEKREYKPRFESENDKPAEGLNENQATFTSEKESFEPKRPRIKKENSEIDETKHEEKLENSLGRKAQISEKRWAYKQSSFERTEFQEFEKKPKNPDEMRLNRYISHAGICSRRDADELIRNGQIKVNGKVITEMGHMVNLNDVIKLDNNIIKPQRFVYVLLNKPKDFITTTEDPNERKTVMDLVYGATDLRIYPVGRLDRNTTGLLLITNDGDLAERLTHPSFEVRKVYQAELDKPITEEHVQQLLNGVELEDGMVKADDVAIITPDAEVIGIEIHSGKNRIVRRMFEALGYEVNKLDRTMFGPLTKKELPRGEWRYLSEREVIRLKTMK